jgi:glycosyltransferase involved in cell wall biosynthesis
MTPAATSTPSAPWASAAPCRIVAYPRYGRLGASSRLRWLQFVPALEQGGLRVLSRPLLGDAYLERKYAGRPVLAQVLRAYLHRARALLADVCRSDLVWIEKELWPWAPSWLERLLLVGRPFVLDYDDAIFHTYDRHRNPLLRRLFGRKVDRLMRAATLVIVGSAYLGERAREAGARRVEWLPTVVDHERYAIGPRGLAGNATLHIGWIGTPATAGYLQAIVPALTEVARRRRIVVHLIGATLDMPGVEIRSIPWSEDDEVRAIGETDVGLMPLPDTPWERGKCGYKLIQYMACGLAVVASPVGANLAIVENGVDGYLAGTHDEWIAALCRLADDPALRHRMGLSGQTKVRARYSLQAAAPQLARWLREVCAQR